MIVISTTGKCITNSFDFAIHKNSESWMPDMCIMNTLSKEVYGEYESLKLAEIAMNVLKEFIVRIDNNSIHTSIFRFPDNYMIQAYGPDPSAILNKYLESIS